MTSDDIKQMKAIAQASYDFNPSIVRQFKDRSVFVSCFTPSRVLSLLAEIERLNNTKERDDSFFESGWNSRGLCDKEQLEAANAVIKYYSNQSSWVTEGSVSDNSLISVIEKDDLYTDKDDAGSFLIGGKRAREYLSKYEGDK